MKLWEKNYLAGFLLFVILLNLSLFVLTASAFQNELEQYRNSAVSEQDSIRYSLTKLYELNGRTDHLNSLSRGYEDYGVHLLLASPDEELTNTLPMGISFRTPADYRPESASLEIVEEGSRKYLCIFDTIDTSSTQLDLVYMKELNVLSQHQKQRVATAMLASLLLSGILGTLLYLTMKNIYRPVENIAHELRTPMTCIRGYAQYLMMARLSEEDRYFASEQILTESQHLQSIVEKLLIMGNLRQGDLERKPVPLAPLLQRLNERYPAVTIHNNGPDTIWGDETLLESLLNNLTQNALEAGSQVMITVEGAAIRIENDGPPLDPALLKALNKNTALPKDQIRGNGFGVRLCHEIVKLHKGKLTYESVEVPEPDPEPGPSPELSPAPELGASGGLQTRTVVTVSLPDTE